MFFNKKKDDDVIKKVYGLTHIEGIPGLRKDVLAQIFLYSDKITINNDKIITIDRIKVVDTFSENEVQTKGKSVLGRAAVGGLLLGPLGAVVGGISGTGEKKKNKIRFFLSIEFLGVDGTDHVGIFMMPDMAIGVSDFVKKINAMIPEQTENAGPHEI